MFVDDAADGESDDDADYDDADLDRDLEGFVCSDRTPSQHPDSGAARNGARRSSPMDEMALYRQGLIHGSGGVPRHMQHMARGGVLDRLFHGGRLTPTQATGSCATTQAGSLTPGAEDGNENVCRRCAHGGDLVMCDHCPASWHVHCLPGQTSASQLPDPWQCPACGDSDNAAMQATGTTATPPGASWPSTVPSAAPSLAPSPGAPSLAPSLAAPSMGPSLAPSAAPTPTERSQPPSDPPSSRPSRAPSLPSDATLGPATGGGGLSTAATPATSDAPAGTATTVGEDSEDGLRSEFSDHTGGGGSDDDGADFGGAGDGSFDDDFAAPSFDLL